MAVQECSISVFKTQQILGIFFGEKEGFCFSFFWSDFWAKSAESLETIAIRYVKMQDKKEHNSYISCYSVFF